jgi:hypothetical protein
MSDPEIVRDVDSDDPRSWPEDIRDWVAREAAHRNPASSTAGDLGWDLVEREAELRALLAPHKSDNVRAFGLRPLTPGLVHRRLREAHEDGLLSEAEHARLDARSVYALGEDDNRDGQVCLIAGRAGLDDDAGCELLLALWGGEAIYWDHADNADAPRLGRPTVVLARIDPAAAGDDLIVFPGLAHLFVASWLGIEARNCDVHLRAGVPAEDILELWQPGHADYDRHAGLPSA